MSQVPQLFVLLPLLAFVISMLVPRRNEKLISGIAIITATIHTAGIVLFILYWLLAGYPILDARHVTLYTSPEFEFFIDFYFDRITAVYTVVGSVITMLVAHFSRYYLHRDHGYKRFFNTLLLFFLGFNLVVFSGNFETLFIGWEILGFCSFLLIAFYRDRYLPVKNALKVISVYRLGDVCLMLAMWMCHHLFHVNITFLQLTDNAFIADHLALYPAYFIFIAIMIVVAAAAKSALLPFSSWLPRAMEGPTTSSAVFYGSLSVHLGAFLLLRTYPFWQDVTGVKIMIIAIGLATSIIASFTAKVQSGVKTQIAYASVTQIGFIFIEIALGFHILALVHFAGNAFLRTYQLLVSPSVLSYEIHDMVFNYKPAEQKRRSAGFQRLQNALFILSIKEWNIDHLMYRYLWMPFKWIGKNLQFLVRRFSIAVLSTVFFIGVFGFFIQDSIPPHIDHPLAHILSVLGLILIIRAFAERNDARSAWLFVLAGQLFVTLSIATNAQVPLHVIVIYLSGIFVAGSIGFACLQYMAKQNSGMDLNTFHGYSYEKPTLSFVFLISCLAVIGFPFTPTFLGIDLLFTHIRSEQILLIVSTTLSFIFIELAILRLFARVFLGPSKVNDHPIAYRSS
ncbi:MAG: proton-conducting transporter membrane subunit [Bacteroidota bacterium]